MLVIENGTVRWPVGPMVEVDDADAYASARGWTDWAALAQPRKTAAVLDASTYVRASFAPPARADEATEGTIQEAVIEAARLSLTGPLIGGDAAGKAARRSVKAGSVSVEFDAQSPEALRSARLALVTSLLRSAGVLSAGQSANVRLAKS